MFSNRRNVIAGVALGACAIASLVAASTGNRSGALAAIAVSMFLIGLILLHTSWIVREHRRESWASASRLTDQLDRQVADASTVPPGLVDQDHLDEVVGSIVARHVRRVSANTHLHTPDSAPPIFVGTTRFSVFSQTALQWKFNRQERTAARLKAELWSRERMGPRVDIFCGLSAPALALMSEGFAYRHLVMISPDLPRSWRAELDELCAAHRFIELTEDEGSIDWRMPVAAAARDLSDHSCPIVEFRVDDDDVLSRNYLQQIEPFATTAHHGTAVSLTQGYFAPYVGGEIGPIHGGIERLSAAGQAYVGWFDADTGRDDIFSKVEHLQVDRYMPTLIDGREPAFLRLLHEGQDTVVGSAERRAQATQVPARFAAIEDLNKFRDLFPSVAPRLRGP